MDSLGCLVWLPLTCTNVLICVLFGRVGLQGWRSALLLILSCGSRACLAQLLITVLVVMVVVMMVDVLPNRVLEAALLGSEHRLYGAFVVRGEHFSVRTWRWTQARGEHA